MIKAYVTARYAIAKFGACIIHKRKQGSEQTEIGRKMFIYSRQ